MFKYFYLHKTMLVQQSRDSSIDRAFAYIVGGSIPSYISIAIDLTSSMVKLFHMQEINFYYVPIINTVKQICNGHA